MELLKSRRSNCCKINPGETIATIIELKGQDWSRKESSIYQKNSPFWRNKSKLKETFSILPSLWQLFVRFMVSNFYFSKFLRHSRRDAKFAKFDEMERDLDDFIASKWPTFYRASCQRNGIKSLIYYSKNRKAFISTRSEF